jgi:hypothetical protein
MNSYPPIGRPDATRPVIFDVTRNGSIGARPCAVTGPPTVLYPQPVPWLTGKRVPGRKDQ